jgi:hypothetical protein
MICRWSSRLSFEILAGNRALDLFLSLDSLIGSMLTGGPGPFYKFMNSSLDIHVCLLLPTHRCQFKPYRLLRSKTFWKGPQSAKQSDQAIAPPILFGI